MGKGSRNPDTQLVLVSQVPERPELVLCGETGHHVSGGDGQHHCRSGGDLGSRARREQLAG